MYLCLVTDPLVPFRHFTAPLPPLLLSECHPGFRSDGPSAVPCPGGCVCVPIRMRMRLTHLWGWQCHIFKAKNVPPLDTLLSVRSLGVLFILFFRFRGVGRGIVRLKLEGW